MAAREKRPLGGAFGLRNFGVNLTADDAEHSKPAPDIFEAALARLENVDTTEAVVIGDTPYDAIAACKAGMKTIGVLTGGFPEETLRGAGAIAVYADVADLFECYDEWTGNAAQLSSTA